MILTDREIQISLDRGLIRIDPRPEGIAFTSSAVDLTLDPVIWIVRDPTPALENVIDPRASGFDAEQVMRELSDEEIIKAGAILSSQKNWRSRGRENVSKCRLKPDWPPASKVKALCLASVLSCT